MTRREYLDHPTYENHRKYYAQFVNDAIKDMVLMYIGAANLQHSKEKYFDDIPIKIWENIAWRHPINIQSKTFKELGETFNKYVAISILKEAAQQIVEELR